MNTISGIESWEQYFTPTTNVRYQNLASGNDISRRAYDTAVSEGLIARVLEGATSFTIINKYFPDSRTTHKIIRADSEAITSMRDMAVANKSPGALPRNTGIAFRLIGIIVSSDLAGGLSQETALQTRLWDSVNDAVFDLLAILALFRSTSTYGVNIEFQVQTGEVLYRIAD